MAAFQLAAARWGWRSEPSARGRADQGPQARGWRHVWHLQAARSQQVAVPRQGKSPRRRKYVISGGFHAQLCLSVVRGLGRELGRLARTIALSEAVIGTPCRHCQLSSHDSQNGPQLQPHPIKLREALLQPMLLRHPVKMRKVLQRLRRLVRRACHQPVLHRRAKLSVSKYCVCAWDVLVFEPTACILFAHARISCMVDDTHTLCPFKTCRAPGLRLYSGSAAKRAAGIRRRMSTAPRVRWGRAAVCPFQQLCSASQCLFFHLGSHISGSNGDCLP